jgi:hypothetical protein
LNLPSTKLWSNVAYAVATVCFAKTAWLGNAGPELWFVYLAIVGLHVSADQLIQLKFGPRQGGNQQ